MRKELFALPLVFCLTSCLNSPSPQDTQPTKESKCAAIRAKMIQAGLNNSTPTAVASSEQINYQDIYHQECE